ncbi:MAG TPA: hypothetical protein VFB22_15930 [Candidatus Baltobacteraceae bacterium]|nr:hypothetical protein [Candidatus Baltobacteraceae bacterium]
MLAVFAALLAAVATPPVPPGIPIPAALVGSVSAATVQAGDTFRFRTTAPVRAGALIIPTGTEGSGIVAAATPGHHGLKPSTLRLEPRVLRLADGEYVAIAGAPSSAPTLDQTRRAHGVPIPFFVGGLFMVGGLGHQAPTVTLAAGTPFTVVTR